ncbi:MAG TPA: HPr(Ser) kinase/phosphatase [Fibrobacteria bacterium]|nr:HPr(Ser) kinase/phosphatase [Fibrobacteria bacterium]HOX52198.1 HPr(Ser) kinase/phosphatase [Fibrobacteria bacterium]
MGRLFQSHGQSLGLEAKTSVFDATIVEPDLHRPGLALAGFTQVFSHKRVQMVGNTEWCYLDSLSPDQRRESIRRLAPTPSPLWIFTHGNPVHPEIIEEAEAHGATVASCKRPTLELAEHLGEILEEHFAPFATVHASLVDVYGIGLLYVGKSGVGKSEAVLDLVERGHRLVADDVVYLARRGTDIIGTGNELLGQHMEIRGVGIIDVASLFGIRAIRQSKRIEMVVELKIWQEGDTYDRTGLSTYTCNLMGVEVPRTIIPLSPGKNITVIGEVIAMNTLLKLNGKDPARTFNERLIQLMNEKREERARRVARWE